MKPIRNILNTLAAAGLSLLAMTLSAAALDATATTWLNVRSGPGAENPVVDTLHPGEAVTVEECEPGGWCQIGHAGPDGWVNASYLEPVTDGGAPTPDCRFQLTLGPGGPTLSIVCDGGGAPGGGGGGGLPPSDPDRACFFDGPNYTGDSICREVGLYPSLPPVANDRITSVRLEGNARVRLCENANMGPYCRDLTTSEAQLGPYLDNKVSSLRVYTGSLPALKQACFFDLPGYTGDHFCMRQGRIDVLPPAANDRATSVALFGGAQATLCVETNLGGYCRTMNSNVPVLGALLNNKASSVLVE
ncbi:SH3 domain-containing protein [Maritimibacter sp. HL-12]|uniref:SH3 domain-containing protein n=1 Tax=Maritimibacter sp. HL-12 TaxID=1162418 RepID=UPI000A0F22DE|nr:SH3 domain-containing protein [Maritimibacter sp. HL-12]SMH37305.1 Uncharacterized conserved protein YraI [Maritimibacter sp. HL-12]